MSQNWSFISAGTVATAANPSPGVPVGYQTGDLLVVAAVAAGTPYSATPPAGYTQGFRYASGFVSLACWYKTAGASESSPTLTNTDTQCQAVMLCYRNVLAFDAVATINSGSVQALATNTLVTTASDDLVISVYGVATGASADYQLSPDAATTQRVEADAGFALSGLLVADEDQAASGTSTARTATQNGGSNRIMNAGSIAFTQSAGGGGGTPLLGQACL